MAMTLSGSGDPVIIDSVNKGLTLTRMTAQASTSGTSIDFPSIPSYAQRITVMLNGVGTNGASLLVIRLGTSGGIVSSGYLGSATSASAAVNTQNWTSGFGLRGSVTGAADLYHGAMVITLMDLSNTWSSYHNMCLSNSPNTLFGSGTISLASALTQVRITTVNGTNAFDAGAINVMYE